MRSNPKYVGHGKGGRGEEEDRAARRRRGGAKRRSSDGVASTSSTRRAGCVRPGARGGFGTARAFPESGYDGFTCWRTAWIQDGGRHRARQSGACRNPPGGPFGKRPCSDGVCRERGLRGFCPRPESSSFKYESFCHVVPGSSTSTSMGVKAKNLKIDANGDLRFSTVATFMEVVQVRRTS